MSADGLPLRAAVIDIGSNSVRLVIYNVEGASALPTFNEKVMAGLGTGLMQTGKLSADGWVSAIRALERFRAILEALGVTNITAVATAAARVARDGPDFLKAAKKALGQKVVLLTGEDEAGLSALGVTTSFHKPRGLVGDLGGSSLEFHNIGRGGGKGESLLLGPLSLAQQAFDADKLRKKVRAALKNSTYLGDAKGQFYAVGGAWRTLAKLNMVLDGYALQVLNGYQLTSGQIARTVQMCVDSVDQPALRARIEAVDKRRVEIMPYAAIILDEVMHVGNFDGLTISSNGLREGVLREAVGVSEGDPLIDGAIAFAQLNGNQIAFGEELYKFVSDAFVDQPDLFGSPTAAGRIKRAACMLADSAGRFHPDHRAIMAYDQALRAPYAGVNHAQRAMIAHAIGYRYSRKFKRPNPYVGLNTEEQASRARQLGTAMRLGAVFSGRSGPILKRAQLKRSKGRLDLIVKKADEAMVSDTVHRRLTQLASLMGLEPGVRIGKS